MERREAKGRKKSVIVGLESEHKGPNKEFTNHSEAIVNYMIEKLISLSISGERKNEINRQIPTQCWEFIHGMLNNYVMLDYISKDRDDYNLTSEGQDMMYLPVLENTTNVLGSNLTMTSKEKGVSLSKDKKISPSRIRHADLNFKAFDLGTQNYHSLDSIEENESERNDLHYNEQNISDNNKSNNNNFNELNENFDKLNNMGTIDNIHHKGNIYDDNNVRNSITKRNNSIYFDNKIFGQNEWSMIEQPISSKIDRNASSVIKLVKSTNSSLPKAIQDDKIEQENNETKSSLTLTVIKEKSKKNSVISGSSNKEVNIPKKKNYSISEFFQNFPIEPENLQGREEEKEIDELRKMKKEEWRKKEEDVKTKLKVDREIQEKAIETVKKQKEYERKNVTTDSNGNILFIKANNYSNSDFLNPKFDVKDKGEVTNVMNIPKSDRNEGKSERKQNFNERFNDSKKDRLIKERKRNEFGAAGMPSTAIGATFSGALNPIDRSDKLAITPAGSSFGLIMPEIGVTIIEAGQSKFGGGGKDYYKAFKKYSKYDYQNMLRDTNVNFSSTMKDFNIDNLNIEYEISEKKEILPKIGYMTRTDGFAGNTIKSTNSMDGSIKMNNKIGGTLKSALEGLDEIMENEEINPQENVEEIRQSDPFKKIKKDDKENYMRSLEEINKFNSSIVNNAQWGANISRGHFERGGNNVHFKPDLKDIEREVGKNIVKTKLPRSRVFSHVKTPNSMPMNATTSSFGMTTNKTTKQGKINKESTDSNFNQTSSLEKKFNRTAGEK